MKTTIKVISLQRSVDRRNAFASANAHIDFEFFDAIDGKLVMADAGNAPDLFEPGLRYNPGAIGCAMSHLMLWQEAASAGRVMTIVEDDAVLRHDFREQSESLLERLPADWDVVVWAWNFDSILSLNLMPGVSRTVMLFDQGKMRASLPAFQCMDDVPSLLRLDKCFGTPAYSISPAGARKFMEQCFPLKNLNVFFPGLNRELPNDGIDIAMNRIYNVTSSYCCLPPLAVTPNEQATSLIQTCG